MRPVLLACLFVLAGGAWVGHRFAALLPEVPRADELGVWTEDYRLERKAGDGFEVADGRWLRVPRIYADFDLQMDVELGENVDLDLVVRQVEPRLVQDRLALFHARFGTLRLSTGGEGPAWRTREETLLGEPGHGVGIAPGRLATVWVGGRGCRLSANVAGKPLPPFVATDDQGMFSLIARGGRAVVHRLVIQHRGTPGEWLRRPWFWILAGAAAGALVLATALARGDRPARIAALGALLALLGHCGAAGLVVEPLRMPPTGALLLAVTLPWLFSSTVLAALAWLGGPVRIVVIALATVSTWWLAGHAREGLRPVDTHQLDAVFGPVAGAQLTEAHAQLVRGPFGLHGPAAADANGKRVMLLGGQLLYGRLRAPEEHLEPLVRGALRAALRAPVEVACLPTQDGHTAQQWAMFSRYFAAGHAPHAIVFGVPREEARADETGRPRSFAATLADTLRRVREHAHRTGAGLVLFTEDGLPADLVRVLRDAAADGVPLVVAATTDEPPAIAHKLATALVPVLR